MTKTNKHGEWAHFCEVKKDMDRQDCPHCGKPLVAFQGRGVQWYEEYLVCEKCKYAQDNTR